jgi:protein-disulfide isomerase
MRNRAASRLAVWLGLALVAGAGCGGAEPAAPLPPVAVPLGDAAVRGPADAWVTIVEFTDFECPYCGWEAPVLEAARLERPAEVRLVVRHFPLPGHLHAHPAAVAAECARRQDRFWPFHDLLYAHQDALGEADLARWATEAGLDQAAWQACREDDAAAQAVDDDLALGLQLGVHATPTLFVNGERIVGTMGPADLRLRIARALARAQGSGIPPADYYQRAVLGR